MLQTDRFDKIVENITKRKYCLSNNYLQSLEIRKTGIW